MKFEGKADYDSWFDRVFAKFTKGIEDHQFIHYNNSMGIHIYGKEHYKAEMKARRMIPSGIMEKFAEDYDKENPKQTYDDLSPKAMDICRSLRVSADKYGNIKLGGNAIKAMVEIGAIQPMSPHVPEQIELSGGFK
jgi:hypothetical protein